MAPMALSIPPLPPMEFAFAPQSSSAAREQAERAREQAERAREQAIGVREQIDRQREIATRHGYLSDGKSVPSTTATVSGPSSTSIE
jgi:hypothetical protein